MPALPELPSQARIHPWEDGCMGKVIDEAAEGAKVWVAHSAE